MWSKKNINRYTALNDKLKSSLSCFRELKKVLNEDINIIAEQMKFLYENVFQVSSFEISLHCDEDFISTASPKLNELYNELNSHSNQTNSHCFSILDQTIGEIQNILVEHDLTTFSSTASFSIPYGQESIFPAFTVLSNLLSNDFIINSVRQTLGAYGAFSVFSSKGYGSLLSIDDQTPVEVIKAFQNDINLISQGKFDDEMLDRAKLKAISDIDAPILPSSRGLEYIFEKYSYEQLQKHRTGILNVTKETIIEASTLIKNAKWNICIFGNREEGDVPKDISVESAVL